MTIVNFKIKDIPVRLSTEPVKYKKLCAFFRRLKYITKEHEHSIYVKCQSCGISGINLPYNDICGNCGSQETIEYYPCGRS